MGAATGTQKSPCPPKTCCALPRLLLLDRPHSTHSSATLLSLSLPWDHSWTFFSLCSIIAVIKWCVANCWVGHKQSNPTCNFWLAETVNYSTWQPKNYSNVGKWREHFRQTRDWLSGRGCPRHLLWKGRWPYLGRKSLGCWAQAWRGLRVHICRDFGFLVRIAKSPENHSCLCPRGKGIHP